MELVFFLIEVVVISLSGVMAPGPVTAAAIGMGARSRYAGALIAVGHGVVEFPLMILIVLGAGRILKLPAAQIVIGLAGGAFLLIMAIQMLKSLRSAEKQQAQVTKSAPVLAGIILSAGNPYFLLWWATIGLALATTATGIGIWAFVLFAIVHWLCDLVWLSALSWASFKGSVLLGPRGMRIVLMICSAALFVFGLFFVYNAGSILIRFILTKN
ncbi:MAG: LysE family transporter [Planctomycetes bacterium]|nr:LysE family transporter [Planctomycetota bacterium]